jgi:hypothetical protein
MNFLKNIADKAKSATESPTRTNATRNSSTGNFKTSVLLICDKLARIRIRGSVPLTNGSGCGSGRPKKTYASGCGYGTLVLLHHSSKIKMYKKAQTVEIEGFLTNFA